MQVGEAFVSGSLGQAIFAADGAFCVIDAPEGEPREALPNEVQWFRHAAREVAPAHPQGLPVSIEMVRSRLREEIRFFNGLDGLLVGMDRDISDALRRRAIARAEQTISTDDGLARRVRARFLIPANTQEWDPAGALILALALGAKTASACYRPLATGIIDRLSDDVASVVLEKHGGGLDATRVRDAVLRSGLLAELASIEARADRRSLSMLFFQRNDFSKLRAADPSGQILTAIVRRAERRIGDTPVQASDTAASSKGGGSYENDAMETDDPIVAAVERAIDTYEARRRRSVEGSAGDLPGIQREIAWIGSRLKSGEAIRAEQAFIKLIDRQGQRSRPEDILKTLTSVADMARAARLFDLTWRILAAAELLGVQDAAAMNVRAETLRELGRHDEALAALEETMRRFPQNEVAPTARAETLRELGRHDEALAAFEETMRRFPQDQVAPTARAETLRELGRHDEALAAFEEAMRRFPHNEVAPIAYAHFLAELGRLDEAEALLIPRAARLRTRDDWIAKHILAMARLRAGRAKEALSEFEQGIQLCKFPEMRRYFETAKTLALLADKRAAEAAQQLETLAKDHSLPRNEMTNIILFQTHALAEAGESPHARALVTSAQVIDFAAAQQKRLAGALTERYGLVSGVPASQPKAQQLNEEIRALEFRLLRPKLWHFRATSTETRKVA